MISCELRLTGPVGQMSHQAIDQHLLDDRLAGRKIDRTLGTYSSPRKCGADYYLDDDSVFYFSKEELAIYPAVKDDTAYLTRQAKIGRETLATLFE